MGMVDGNGRWSDTRASAQREELELAVQSRIGPIVNIRDIDIFSLREMYARLLKGTNGIAAGDGS